VHEAFREWHLAWLHVVSLCAVLILMARPQADRPEVVVLFTAWAEVVTEDLLRAFELAGLEIPE
jgi:hypothetical protein